MSMDSLIKKAIAKQPTIKPRTKRNAQPEAAEQENVIKWARDNEKTYPFLWMLHSSLNGVRLSKIQAGKAKASGMLSGVPDLFLPVPRGCFFGLYIEMKSATGRIMPSQSRYLKAVSDFGYNAVVCYSASEAIKTIENYYFDPK